MTPSPLKGPERTIKQNSHPQRVECWGMKLGRAQWISHCWLEVNSTSSWDQLSRCHLSHLTAFPDLPPGEFTEFNLASLIPGSTREAWPPCVTEARDVEVPQAIGQRIGSIHARSCPGYRLSYPRIQCWFQK